MVGEKENASVQPSVDDGGGFPPLTAADRVPNWTAAERERIAKLDPVTDLKELLSPERRSPSVAGLINELVAARANARAWKVGVAELRAAWENEHKLELTGLERAKERLASADKALRLEALALYDKHGGVPNAPGVGVKVRRVAKYDADAAIRWAVHHELHQFLAVNAKLFAKHALAVADTAPLGFVTIAREPFATLAKNLKPWVSAQGAARP